MSRIIKITAIIIGLALVGFIGRCFYMIACISCTYPPIKEYKFQGTVEQFGEALYKFTLSNPDISYKISCRDSTQQDDNGNRDIVIKLKRDTNIIRYDFVCDEGTSTAQIKMVAAFINNTHGGYTADYPEVKTLVGVFENDLLSRLNRPGHVILKPE